MKIYLVIRYGKTSTIIESCWSTNNAAHKAIYEHHKDSYLKGNKIKVDDYMVIERELDQLRVLQ